MHYSLQDQQTPPKINSLEEFLVLLKRISSIKKVGGLPPEECSLCSINKIDIARSCKVSPYPCEGHECACFTEVESSSTSKPSNHNNPSNQEKPVNNPPNSSNASSTNTNSSNECTDTKPMPPLQYFPACFKCIATLLFSKTNSFMRENGRWRANCPFCKAEFCHLDLIVANPPKIPQSETKHTSKRKKGSPKNKKV